MDFCSIRSTRRVAVLTFLAALLTVLVSRQAHARINGIDSTQFLSRSPPNCNACHTGGTAPTNMVNLTASASDLTPGQQITLTLTVATINGSPGAAGFNLRSSQQGIFAVGGAASASTRVLTGTNGWSEATHSEPKQGEPATFTVLWTPSAGTSGGVTFTAWGNAVNESGTRMGDAAASATAVVSITPICTPVTWYRDVDGDGYGSAGDTTSSCAQPAGYVSNGTDCNDLAESIHPGAAEACNGIDDNCAGGVDEGLATSTFYLDGDGDGYGRPDATKVACSLAQAGTGYVASGGDCDDTSTTIHPGATEACNGIDDNCVGGIDEGLATSTFYLDGDGDGYGSSAAPKVACSLAQAGPGYVANAADCNDANMAIHPNAAEACNGVDDDCDGAPDNGLATSTFYRDADGDGYGAADVTKTACSLEVAGAGYVVDHTDCNDADKNVFPGAPEICANLKDDNCNGVVDTDAPANSTFYKDVDGDGYGSATSGTAMACSPPAGYVSNNTDCNDGDGAIHPGATEVCNGKDDNCAGGADEALGTISCGDGACRRTVDACVGGVPQVCMPMCPDAGADGRADAEVADAIPADAQSPLDVAPSDVARPTDVASIDSGFDAASGDVISTPPDASVPSDGSAPPVEAGSTVDAGSGSPDARVDAGRPRDAASPPGANEDGGSGGDTGCSCRMGSQAAGAGGFMFGGAAFAFFVLARRRRRAR